MTWCTGLLADFIHKINFMIFVYIFIWGKCTVFLTVLWDFSSNGELFIVRNLNCERGFKISVDDTDPWTCHKIDGLYDTAHYKCHGCIMIQELCKYSRYEGLSMNMNKSRTIQPDKGWRVVSMTSPSAVVDFLHQNYRYKRVTSHPSPVARLTPTSKTRQKLFPHWCSNQCRIP